MLRGWSGAFAALLCAACARDVTAPDAATVPNGTSLGGPEAGITTAATTPVQLASGGTSSTIFARAISPDGWILGNFYLAAGGPVRAQSWSPFPELTVDTVASPGSVYSGTDGHGDVTAHGGDVAGPVVYLADPVTKGRPYAVLPLPRRSNMSAGNTIAFALNDEHVVVGFTVGSAALVWLPITTRTWKEPIDLPRPFYPGGYGAFESQAMGINDSGFVVGQVGERVGSNKPIVRHAILWRILRSGEVWTTALVGELPRDPQATGHRAEDINNAGVISGVIMTGRGEFPALWFPDAPGVYSRPPTVLSGTRDWAVGKLNACGWLAFTGMGKSTTESYVWDGGTPVLLPRLTGSSGGRAYDVSDQGDVVGMARFTPKNQNSYSVAALWRGAVAPCAP